MPLADGSNYWFFGSPRIESDLLLDVGTNGFVDIAKYDPSRVGGIMNGEIGKAATCRFVIDNDALTDTVSSVYAMGFMTGAEALREVCVYPFHLRAQRNLGQDFDSQMAMAWVSFLGVKALWNHTTHGIGSIVHYTSA